MIKWIINTSNVICIDPKNSDDNFKAYYKKYPLSDNDYIEISEINSDEQMKYINLTFTEVNKYLIKIVNENTNDIKYINISVEEDNLSILKNQSDIALMSINKLKNILESDTTGLIKIINDIQALPDGTRLDLVLSKIDQLQLSVTNLKNKTVAFINH